MAITRDMWRKVRSTVAEDDGEIQEDIDLSLKINNMGGVIIFDHALVTYSSLRRVIKNPFSFFLVYPYRTVKTLWENRRT